MLIGTRLLWGLSLLLGAQVLGPGSQAVPEPAPPGTLLIRRGGTYSGTYISHDSDIPCVRIETDEPVTLRHCVLRGPGRLIDARYRGAQLTVHDCQGYGQRPTQEDVPPGRFLETYEARSLQVHHNYFEHTSGILVLRWLGDGSPGQTLRIAANQVRNADGRHRTTGSTKVNFLILNQVRGLANAEIAWNEVINEPNNSLVEDNINIYESSGTSDSPLRIHDNYIQGAYPFPATSAQYTGSGLTIDGDDDDARTTCYVQVTDNQVVAACNSGLNLAAGHHVEFRRNRVVSASCLPDGTYLPSSYCGLAVFNHYQQSDFGQHVADENVLGYVNRQRRHPYPQRNDEADFGEQIFTRTRHLPNPITKATERQEWQYWQQKLARSHQRPGPTPTPAL